MADEIIIDGLEENAFRRSIESMLRHGRADEAADRLRALLPEVAGSILPARLVEITSKDLGFAGWEQIPAKLEEYGRPETPITASGIGICDPLDSGITPDEHGNLRPPLETTYYSDATYPFSQTDREDLLEGYSSFGCEWQGDHDRADHALAIEGIDDIYGAIAALENKVATSDQPSPKDIRAGALAACYLGVLVYQAARDAVIAHGLPRPLAILLVNSDAYPFFDAPVLTCDEYLDKGKAHVTDGIAASVSSSRAFEEDRQETELVGSLIDMTVSSSMSGSATVYRKKMALALEGDEAANPLGMADELVAEAAFNPTTFDYSHFMPKAPAHEEALSGADERHASAEAAPDAHSADLHKPLDLTQGCTPLAPEEETPPQRAWPEPTAWQSARHPEPEPEPELEQPQEVEIDSPSPSPHTYAESATETYLNPSNPVVEEHQPEGEDSVQPTGHSLRSRIRIAPVEEEVPSAMDKLQGSFARFVKRVKDLLLRR